MQFCGVRENFGEGMQVKLPTLTPTWYFQGTVRNIDTATVRSVIQKSLDSWSKHCAIRFSEASSPSVATLRIITERIDGPSNVLADCQLPYPGMKQLLMRLDDEKFTAELAPQAGTIGLRHVIAHEAGHALSLGHLAYDNTPDLMNPQYSPGIYEPQADEGAIVRKLYGAPETPTGPNGKVAAKIQVTIDGVTWEAAGPMRRIT